MADEQPRKRPSPFGDDEAPKKPAIFTDADRPAKPSVFSDADKPAAPKVFSDADRPAAPAVFREGEKGRCCRYCRHYVVNPFTQRCALRRREVEATDVCPRFESTPPDKA